MSKKQIFLRPQEAAQELGVTVKTIHRWDAAGKIRTIRTVGNQRRIPASEIKRLLGDLALIEEGEGSTQPEQEKA
ncbi:MAG: excisionase family DNA-binding protein [Chloroflexi bacterium]|nr:excisionase family DNA-binding protein [Chloroflexota bacterium]